MRTTYLPFALPSFGEDEKHEVLEALDSGWLASGPRTKQFEKGICDYLEVPYAIGVNSGTAALHLSLAALGIAEGDEVVTTPFTFCSTVNVILQQKAVPVLADISSDTWNIDPEKVSAAVTHKTRAIIPVHFGGHPCEMDQLLDISNDMGLSLIGNATQAMGAQYKGTPIGKISDLTCFTLGTIGNVTAGEGGVITANRDELEEKLRILAFYGITKNNIIRFGSESAWFYRVMFPGYEYALSEMQAAIGIHQLRKLESFISRRTEIALKYRNAFEDIEAIEMPEVKPYVRHAWRLFPVLINTDMITIDRAQFVEELHKRNIGSNVHFIPIHFHPFYKDIFGDQEGRYPISEWIYYREISLPIYPGMLEQDVNDVIEAVTDVVNKFHR